MCHAYQGAPMCHFLEQVCHVLLRFCKLVQPLARTRYLTAIVPMLRVGMPLGTLCVPKSLITGIYLRARRDAERPEMHYHAERGNDR